MFRAKRTYLTTALLTLASFAAGAVSVDTDPVAVAKRDMVNKAVQTGLNARSAHILEQAIQRASALTEVQVDSATREPIVRLRLSNTAVCDAVTAFDGTKITLNLYCTVMLLLFYI